MKNYIFLVFIANISHIAAAFFLSEALARRCMYEIGNSFATAEERSQLLNRFQVMNERVRMIVREEQYVNVEEHGLRQEFAQFLRHIRQGKLKAVLEMLNTHPVFSQCFCAIESGGGHDDLRTHDTTALHCAVRHGQSAIALELILRGADVNGSDEEGRTALHVAVFHQQKRLAQLLLTHGAYVCKLDADGKDPITYAMEREEMALTRIVLDHLLHSGDHDQVINLIVPHIILRSRRIPAYKEYFHFLLHHPLFDCDAQNNAGSMPIHIAVAFECTDAFNMLLEAGAWYDAQNRAGCSALMEAVRYYRLARRGRYLIKLLMPLSDLSVSDKKGYTAENYLEMLGCEGLEFLEEKKKYESRCNAALKTVTNDILPHDLHGLMYEMVFGHTVKHQEAGLWESFKALLQS